MTTAAAAWEIETSSTPAARRLVRVDRRALRHLIAAALRAEAAPPIVLSVTLVDDAEITEINRTYLGKDGHTDVISFEIAAPGTTHASETGAGAPHVGDIYVSVERARAQAAARRRPWEAEVRLLVVHGVLHSLGHDDEEPGARRVMRQREKVCLAAASDVALLFTVE